MSHRATEERKLGVVSHVADLSLLALLMTARWPCFGQAAFPVESVEKGPPKCIT